jgi:DeoR/GlpR family transcriptional regulator of sugar metabolism
MPEERESLILDMLKARRRVLVSEITERFGVSEVTARKDLSELEKRGLAIRTRGGAVPSSLVAAKRPVDERASERGEAKEAIAREALRLLRPGSTVFIDSGSTCAALARLIALDGSPEGLLVISHSLWVFECLAHAKVPGLISLGGEYRAEARCFSSAVTIEQIRRYSTDIAFVGASGLDYEGAASAQSAQEAEVKRLAFARAGKRVILADSGKIGARALAVFAYPEEYDLVVTDPDADPGYGATLKERGVELVIAGSGEARETRGAKHELR